MGNEKLNRENASKPQGNAVNRRDFLTKSALAGAGLAMNPFSGAGGQNDQHKDRLKEETYIPKPGSMARRRLGSLEVSARNGAGWQSAM